MKHLAFAALALLASLAACNSAQLIQPPPTDSGSSTCEFAPVFTECDGGTEAGPPCGALDDAGIPSGSYPVSCLAITHHYTSAAECAIALQCTCSSDGGTSQWACTE